MIKSEQRIMADIYFYCTILGVALFPILPGIGLLLLQLGACSAYVSFCSVCFAETGFEALFQMGWFILLLIFLVISFLRVRKGHYGLFTTLMFLDAGYIVVWSIYQMRIGNDYGASCMILDIAVNLAFIGLFLYYRIRDKRGNQTTTADNQEKRESLE